jgi:hypothetical protein
MPNLEQQQTLDNLFNELKARKAVAVDPSIRWYKNNRLSPLIWFRVSGITVIIFSIILPTIVSSKLENKELISSVLSLTIATFTGLNAFFQWQNSWKSRSLTYKQLLQLQEDWELKMLQAKYEDDTEEAKKTAFEATSELILKVSNITEGETKSFFGKLKFPDDSTHE